MCFSSIKKTASPSNPQNDHLQKVIDAFLNVFNEDEEKCLQKMSQSLAHGFVNTNDKNRGLHAEGKSTMANSNIRRKPYLDSTKSSSNMYLKEEENQKWNTTIFEGLKREGLQRRLALKWHPFHPDIQKTVHFWGYDGSFTEPPCTSNSVSWKIMDVPTPISQKQLEQLKHILFNHVDKDCHRTSVHNAYGSVARPTQRPLDYYKCTRDDYVSDEERAICGDQGCVKPFGAGLNPYYPPLVHVTGPPTRSPS